jgi:TolA-binding protein
LAVLLAGALSPEQSRQLAERYNAAQAAIGQRNYVKASADLNTLVRDFGSSEFGDEMRYALAETYFNLGQYDRGDVRNRDFRDDAGQLQAGATHA